MLSEDRTALFRLLRHQASLFEDRNRFEKLLRAPYRFLVSEASSRLHKIVRTQATTFWGERMEIALPEPVSHFLYRYGYFEEGLTAFFLTVLRKGDCFMDVGSHFGYFSLLARHLVGSSGTVVAFEPTPSTHAVNRRNTSRHENIRVETCAAWSQPKMINLTDLGVAWSSHNSLVKPKMIPEEVRASSRTYEVPCVKLDDYISTHNLRPRLIKIDAESAELEILKGLGTTLRTLRPLVTVEVGDDPALGGIRSADAVQYCNEFGYDSFIYVDGQIRPHQRKDTYEYDNVFLIPEELVHETVNA